MTDDVVESEPPTHCPMCGTALDLQPAEVTMTPAREEWDQGADAADWAVDKCPNPGCPGKST